MPEFPRCAQCRVIIIPGQNVVFRTDGRVAHVECPEVVCPVCTRNILPGEPIRRNGEEILHGNCWMRRHRVVAGGATESAWTVLFDSTAKRRLCFDRPAFEELRAAVAETHARARTVRRFAQTMRRRRREPA